MAARLDALEAAVRADGTAVLRTLPDIRKERIAIARRGAAREAVERLGALVNNGASPVLKTRLERWFWQRCCRTLFCGCG